LGTRTLCWRYGRRLRLTIKAVARLPFDPERLVEILCDLELDAAKNSAHDDHTIFWLVVADQFTKYGIGSDKAREKALQILEDGSDINIMRELGMGKGELKQRQRHLDKLKERLLSPITKITSRAIFKEPEPYILDIGDLFLYPTDKGRCINPYMSPREVQANWQQDSWSATIIIDRGRALDYLSWYRALTLVDALKEKPSFITVKSLRWILRSPGTLSVNQLKRIKLTKIETVQISETKIHRFFPDCPSGSLAAISGTYRNTRIVQSAYFREGCQTLQRGHLACQSW
jgi:hypothetical protein